MHSFSAASAKPSRGRDGRHEVRGREGVMSNSLLHWLFRLDSLAAAAAAAACLVDGR